jgi:hypothetical protein
MENREEGRQIPCSLAQFSLFLAKNFPVPAEQGNWPQALESTDEYDSKKPRNQPNTIFSL